MGVTSDAITVKSLDLSCGRQQCRPHQRGNPGGQYVTWLTLPMIAGRVAIHEIVSYILRGSTPLNPINLGGDW